MNLNKKLLLSLIPFVLLGIFYLSGLNRLPLTAYDEATYAQVTRDTLASGQNFTLYRLGQPWFEKPPLYFWLSMASTKVFGAGEWAYRLPSALLAIVTLVLVYFLVKQLTANKCLAVLSSIILGFIPFFYITARQVRLDVPLTAIILAVLFTVVVSWRRPAWLWLVAPLIALGLMMKSIPALSALLFVFILSFFYKQWSWLKDKRLWLGLVPALAILLPWHIYMQQHWGSVFWQSYLGQQVWERAAAGFGNTNYFYYIKFFRRLSHFWWWIFLLAMPTVYILQRKLKNQEIFSLFQASLFSFIITLVIFSLAKTHISTYLLPVYPFMAIVIAVALVCVWQILKKRYLKMVVVILFVSLLIDSFFLCLGYWPQVQGTLHYSFDYNLRDMAKIVTLGSPVANIYQLDGPQGDVLSYYSARPVTVINRDQLKSGYQITGPAYILVTDYSIGIFFDQEQKPLPVYQKVQIVYFKDHLVLLFSEQSLTMSL
ncbi:MAG: hypothetical protein C3F02_03165 [Parcubacteria group bacterium]|nr:MAG: hypothetical protein C3F02_03165 [Parcubacteria group bacterium]